MLKTLANMCLIFEHFCKFGVLCLMRQNSFDCDKSLKSILPYVETSIDFGHAAASYHASQDVRFYCHEPVRSPINAVFLGA
jgi:hypothetical protein